MPEYRLTNKAVEDLADIWRYTCAKWSEKQADDYYESLLASCRQLSEHPELSGKRYDEILQGLRGFKSNKHIIFYRISQDGEVEIIRILHGSMDLPNRMNP